MRSNLQKSNDVDGPLTQFCAQARYDRGLGVFSLERQLNVSLSKTISIVATVLEVDPRTLDSDTEAQSIDVWDSLRHLAIITAIEEEFEVELSMDVITEVDGIAALHQAVTEAVSAVQ